MKQGWEQVPEKVKKIFPFCFLKMERLTVILFNNLIFIYFSNNELIHKTERNYELPDWNGWGRNKNYLHNY
jgi:hypothetical protein